MGFAKVFIFFLKIFSISSKVIIPGLKMVGFPVKSIIVDSIPIGQLPPFNINFILSPNSSATSFAEVALGFDDIFALGAARGNFILLSKLLAIL